jgi:hypothetical protein
VERDSSIAYETRRTSRCSRWPTSSASTRRRVSFCSTAVWSTGPRDMLSHRAVSAATSGMRRCRRRVARRNSSDNPLTSDIALSPCANGAITRLVDAATRNVLLCERGGALSSDQGKSGPRYPTADIGAQSTSARRFITPCFTARPQPATASGHGDNVSRRRANQSPHKPRDEREVNSRKVGLPSLRIRERGSRSEDGMGRNYLLRVPHTKGVCSSERGRKDSKKPAALGVRGLTNALSPSRRAERREWLSHPCWYPTRRGHWHRCCSCPRRHAARLWRTRSRSGYWHLGV